MYGLIKNYKTSMLALCYTTMIAATFYFCIRFHEITYLANLPVSTSLSWLLPGAIAVMLACVAFWKFSLLCGFMLFLGGFYLITDLIGLTVHFLLKSMLFARVWETVYFGGLLPIFLTCLVCLRGYVRARTIKLTTYRFALPRLSCEGGALRIAMFSDMHLGTNIRPADLPRIVKRIQALAPDLILLCGDIYEESTSAKQLALSVRAFQKLQARHGIFYVPGNHEYRAQANGTLNMKNLEQLFAKAGIRTLKDETLLVDERFYIVGRKDTAAGERASAKALLEGVEQQYPVLLMDHRPTELKEVAQAGVHVQFSGHTHGGQLFRIGKKCERRGRSEMIYGHRQVGSCHTIVSSGIGTWGFPLRLGSRSEIVVVDVTPA